MKNNFVGALNLVGRISQILCGAFCIASVFGVQAIFPVIVCGFITIVHGFIDEDTWGHS